MTQHLEILQQLPKKASKKPPLLFVHGAFTAAWCWDEYFLGYFAQHGYPAYAVSLRGHGGSRGSYLFATVQDYLADLTFASQQVQSQHTDAPPVLIGHSMGGVLVQKYLEKHPISAAILMNSVPPQGLTSSLLHMSFNNPILLQYLSLIQGVSLQFATPHFLREAIFSADIPEDKLNSYFFRMDGESVRVNLDLFGLDLPDPEKRPTDLPMLAVGAANDSFFPVSATKSIAKAYQADMHIFDDIAHAMMLEQRWQGVADFILDWLQRKLAS